MNLMLKPHYKVAIADVNDFVNGATALNLSSFIKKIKSYLKILLYL